ncbi:MAG: acyl transferase domain-containing protein [Planctomycetota bacterium]|jgi:acyl transferase domain-containing protein
MASQLDIRELMKTVRNNRVSRTPWQALAEWWEGRNRRLFRRNNQRAEVGSNRLQKYMEGPTSQSEQPANDPAMTERTIPRPENVEVSRSSLNSLKVDVAKERRKLKSLSTQLTQEKLISERAIEEALQARIERDDYRRVLAAAIRGEQLIKESKEQLGVKLAEVEDALKDSIAGFGRATGLNEELSSRLESSTAEITTQKEELNAQRSRFETTLAESSITLGRTEGRLQEMERQEIARLKDLREEPQQLLRVRSLALFAGSAIAFATAAALLPPLFRVLFGSASAEEMLLATGLSGWGVFVAELLLLGLGTGLATLGLRRDSHSGNGPLRP